MGATPVRTTVTLCQHLHFKTHYQQQQQQLDEAQTNWVVDAVTQWAGRLCTFLLQPRAILIAGYLSTVLQATAVVTWV
jgi:hypothetical protein